jgi:hypothetical protein
VAAEAAALVPASAPTAAEDGAAEDEATAEMAALWAELAAAWEQAEEVAAAAQWCEEISAARHVAELGRMRGRWKASCARSRVYTRLEYTPECTFLTLSWFFPDLFGTCMSMVH